MKATLGIENIHIFSDEMKLYGFICDCVLPGSKKYVVPKFKNRCWVAHIVGSDEKYKFKREFLKPKTDYTKSNSKGSRGVYLWYLLESGNIYDVSETTSWKNVDRYFCKVSEDGDIIKITEEEVKEWIKKKENILE